MALIFRSCYLYDPSPGWVFWYIPSTDISCKANINPRRFLPFLCCYIFFKWSIASYIFFILVFSNLILFGCLFFYLLLSFSLSSAFLFFVFLFWFFFVFFWLSSIFSFSFYLSLFISYFVSCLSYLSPLTLFAYPLFSFSFFVCLYLSSAIFPFLFSCKCFYCCSFPVLLFCIFELSQPRHSPKQIKIRNKTIDVPRAGRRKPMNGQIDEKLLG